MYLLDNDFAFKCVATDIKKIFFNVNIVGIKNEAITQVTNSGRWETTLIYKIKSDKSLLNKKVIVTAGPKQNKNSNTVKEEVLLKLPEKCNILNKNKNNSTTNTSKNNS